MLDILDEFTALAMAEYDAMVAGEKDPALRRAMERDRQRVAEIVRAANAEQLLKAASRHVRAPEELH